LLTSSLSVQSGQFNSIVMSVARYFARLPDQVHVAAWVDDLHFSMRTPAHPPCLGHAGGCPVCTTAYHRAVSMEQLWKSKALALNLPLSVDKGHSVAQGGPFTGIMIDTLQGLYSMLADKLDATRAAFTNVLQTTTSTPRLLASCRGKAFHYGCAVPYLAISCPALTQAIHQVEHASDRPAPSLADEDTDPDFDWDRPLLVSTRARATLRLLLRTLDEFGTVGRPMWPDLPCSVFGAFCTGSLRLAPSSPLILLSHASPRGWAAASRSDPDGPPQVFSESWDAALNLFDAHWMAGVPWGTDGTVACVAHQHALAVLLALHHFGAQSVRLRRQWLIRSQSAEAIHALQHGCSADPVLQDIAMLFQVACMDLQILPPMFLLAPSAPAPTPRSDPCTSASLADSATPLLHRLISTLAARSRNRISIDLFATAANSFCPRYFSESYEQGAEGQDALSQPSWASSLCPTCALRRPEFVLLFPPFPLIRQAVRKAQCDRAHGIMVVPFATTADWWHTAVSASVPRSHPNRLKPALRIACDPRHVSLQSNPPGYYLAIIHFDFWQGPSPRPRPCIHSNIPRSPQLQQLDPDQRALWVALQGR
jgi:hypothetical protein